MDRQAILRILEKQHQERVRLALLAWEPYFAQQRQQATLVTPSDTTINNNSSSES